MTYTNVIQYGIEGSLTDDLENLIEELKIENERLKFEVDKLNRLLAYHVLSEIENR